MHHTTSQHADVAIIGGGLGGTAAALAVARSGLNVILTEPTDWLGGQLTSQGVSAPDEHPHIERMGGTFSYYTLRERLRAAYARAFPRHDTTNPGNGWVSRLCVEPIAAVHAINAMLAPYHARLTVHYRYAPIAAHRDGHTVRSVTLRHPDGHTLHVTAQLFIDATELGDLLPLLDLPHITGAESHADTAEPHAPAIADPHAVQSFTFPFAVDFRPNESHIIPPPRGYTTLRDTQPYSFTLHDHDGNPKTYPMFDGPLPFWTYRRIFDGTLDNTHDISMINWHGNDYYGRSLITTPPAPLGDPAAIDEAKRLSLGFLHWLQTEAPRDDGGAGYPELRLRRDVMGTPDGLSKAPYVRESRRIVPRYRITETDISAATNPEEFARPMPLSVGIGWYHMDVHACVGQPDTSLYLPTKPFELPLGALLPAHADNLIAGAKNIGTTHLTNGAYRVHPTEWQIGESAGELAAFVVLNNVISPHAVHDDRKRFITFKTQHLTRNGIRTSWHTAPPPG